jgi:primary-amine oxidase
VRDRGLAWKDDQKVRRGEELVLWGALDAANYNYIIEWTFRDDGVIRGRVGATGVNFPGHPFVAHTHNPTWRLDIDLNGSAGDSVHLGTHTEMGLTAIDTAPLIDRETGVEWDPLHFHTLQIHDAGLTNARGSASAYHLMPLRWGTARHAEGFTKYDFWVTKYNPMEIFAARLPSYISPPESVANTDIVVWYTGSMHHLVRDEDGVIVSGFWEGEAHVMSTEFILKPHNLFDETPLFP